MLACTRQNSQGMAHLNPILDMRSYKVEFPDGQTTEYSANIIAKNMYAQCDTEGNQYLLLKEIVDWKKDNSATSPADMYVIHSMNKHFYKTTKGWQLCVEWKDHGTTSWEQLADLRVKTDQSHRICSCP